MIKGVQYFTSEYIKECQKMSIDERLQFLEDYRKLLFDPGELKQINLRIPERVVTCFKMRAKREGKLYQHKIRELMTEWALG